MFKRIWELFTRKKFKTTAHHRKTVASWKKKNPDKVKTYNKKYYDNNKEYWAEYRKTKKAKAAQARRLKNNPNYYKDRYEASKLKK